MDSQKRTAIVLLWSRKPRSFFNTRPPVVHIQALFSPAAHLPKLPTPPLTGVFLLLIPPGMWLWLWRGCPVCALPEQSLQRGPEPAEVQTLPGLWTHQPLPEGQLLHHQQCRVWRLSAGVRGTDADSCVTVKKLLFTKTKNMLKHKCTTINYRLCACLLLLCPRRLRRLKHVILCLQQILQEDKVKWIPRHGVYTVWGPSTSLRASL